MQKTRLRRTKIKLTALLFTVLVFQISVFEAAASEEENIDTFDVHPANRWDLTNVGTTISVANSMLNISDTGDASADYAHLYRKLRASDGKIEFRFMLDALIETNHSDNERVLIGLSGDSAYNAFVLGIGYPQESDYWSSTYFYYYDTSNTYRQLTLSGSERVHDDTWYVLTIDYNIVKSKVRFKLAFDNGTRVFDYYQYEICGNYISQAFNNKAPRIFFRYQNQNAGCKYQLLVDYLKAPFAERTWKQSDTPADSDYLEDTWSAAVVQDDINDESQWKLSIPYLDSVAGTMSFQWSDEAGIDNNDLAAMAIGLYAVDANDGDLHEVFLLTMYQLRSDIAGGPDWGTFLEIYEDGVKTHENYTNHNAWPLYEQPKITFTIQMSEDRTIATLKARFWIDIDSNVYSDYLAEATIADIADDPSQEFVLLTDYTVDFDHDIEWRAVIDMQYTFRESFAGISPGVGDQTSGGGSNFIVVILTEVGKFLAGIFKGVGEVIVNGINAVLNTIDAVLDTVSATLTNIYGVAVSVATDIGTMLGDLAAVAADLAAYVISFASDIATAIWDAAESALAFIIDAIEAIWITLGDAIPDILDWIISAVTAIISDIVDLLTSIIFLIWDALGLPNVLAILDFLLLGSLNFLDDAVNLLTWVKDVLFFWGHGVFLIGIIIFWLVPVIRGKGDFGEFAESFFTMNSWNIMPFSVFGINVHLPVGFVFWPLLFMYVFAVTGTWT